MGAYIDKVGGIFMDKINHPHIAGDGKCTFIIEFPFQCMIVEYWIIGILFKKSRSFLKFLMEVLLMQDALLVGFDKCVGKLDLHDSNTAKS